MEHSTVHTLLDDLAGSPAPHSTVDVFRAIQTGRQRIRRRRLFASGSAALGVVATLFLAVALTRLPDVPPITDSPIAAPATFDPLVAYAELRRLPFTPDTVDTTVGRNFMTVIASQERAPAATIRLTVVTANHEVANPFRAPVGVRPGTAAHGQPADLLNGHRAEWTWAGSDTAALRWEYTPGAWAEVSVAGLDGDPRQLARDVAGGVRFGVNTRLHLPFRVDGVPSPLGLRMVTWNYSAPGRWRVSAYFGRPDAAPGDVLPLSITASRPSIVDQIEPNSTVDGHPALTGDTEDGQSLLSVYNVDTMDVTLAADTVPPGGFESLFRTLGPRRSPSTWY